MDVRTVGNCIIGDVCQGESVIVRMISDLFLFFLLGLVGLVCDIGLMGWFFEGGFEVWVVCYFVDGFIYMEVFFNE
jgi:hypothetical protein